MVTGLPDRQNDDPATYAAQIREIQDKYGDILVLREKEREQHELSGQLQSAIKTL